jgi:hypothetical protein
MRFENKDQPRNGVDKIHIEDGTGYIPDPFFLIINPVLISLLFLFA